MAKINLDFMIPAKAGAGVRFILFPGVSPDPPAHLPGCVFELGFEVSGGRPDEISYAYHWRKTCFILKLCCFIEICADAKAQLLSIEIRADARMKTQGRSPVPRQSSHNIVPKDAPAAKKATQPRDPVASGERDAAHNRAASHNYFLLEKFEAGVALRGTEVKSIREGKANLKDSYGLIKDGEAFLLNLHIGPYSHGNMANHDETRTRKLLLHREEVSKLLSKTQIKGHTLIPTRLYFRNGRVKCELAVAKGKQDWDKRETERRREADREARAAIKVNKHRGGR
jgi:SsrA-binding protein